MSRRDNLRYSEKKRIASGERASLRGGRKEKVKFTEKINDTQLRKRRGKENGSL